MKTTFNNFLIESDNDPLRSHKLRMEKKYKPKYIKKFEYNTQEILNDELLKYSSNKSALQKLRDLISQGADVNCRGSNTRTPLLEALNEKFYSAAKLFIKNGADVNAVDKHNNTSLMFAVTRSRWNFEKNPNVKKVVDLLIESGVDISIKNDNGNDIFHTKIESFDKMITEYISNKFPKEYKEYLFKQDVEKYNL